LRIVVTNDDGVHTRGLAALGTTLLGEFPDTLVVAPLNDCGGCGTSIRAGGMLPVPGATSLLEFPPNRIHALAAPPALLVLGACDGVFGPPPDLVVAGINYGPNVGRAILHSGTIGAALTAVAMDIRALAISLDDMHSTGGREDGYMHWETAAAVAVPLARWLAQTAPGTAVNVNVPNRHLHAIQGVRPALPASRKPTLRLDPAQGCLVELPDLRQDPSGEPASSEVALLAAGYVTITPLGLLTPAAVDAAPAARWLEEALPRGSGRHEPSA
jgi:5'-nucleotidase